MSQDFITKKIGFYPEFQTLSQNKGLAGIPSTLENYFSKFDLTLRTVQFPLSRQSGPQRYVDSKGLFSLSSTQRNSVYTKSPKSDHKIRRLKGHFFLFVDSKDVDSKGTGL